MNNNDDQVKYEKYYVAPFVSLCIDKTKVSRGVFYKLYFSRKSISLINQLLVVLMFCFISGIAYAAEPQLKIYYHSGGWMQEQTRAAVCPGFERFPGNNYYNIVFTDPRLGEWMFPETRYQLFQASFSCVYTQYRNGVLYLTDDSRSVGTVRCGNSRNDRWLVDKKEERCVCSSGLMTIYGDCVTSCPDGQTPIDGVCHGVKNNGPICGNLLGNPINIGGGNKYQRQLVWSDTWGLGLRLAYNSQDSKSGYFGRHWRSNWDRGIDEMSDDSTNIYRSDGHVIKFMQTGSTWISDPDIQDRLIEITDEAGERTGWEYNVASNNEVETYDTAGKLLSIHRLDGYEVTLSYSSGQYSDDGNEFYVDTDGTLTTTLLEKGLLVKVSDSLGREITFKYGSAGNIAIATDVSGKDYKFAYDTTWRRLDGIAFPSESGLVTRVFHYETPDIPYVLTGITDENGNRFATWTYDGQGRAISSEHANGVDKTTLTYNADGTTTVTNPLGKQTTYHFTTINGVRKVTQVEGHPTTSCEGANKSYQYDANGNVISKTDWNGVTTTYTYDMTRNLELSRTEAVGTPQERTITTEWHSDYRLPVRITEPGKITEYTYDTQGRRLSSKVSSVQ